MERVDLLAADPARAAVVLDVDGTLAPIVRRPEDAAVPAEARVELARLTGRYGLVACVSGRGSDDVRRMVGVDGIAVVGEHGLELDPEAEAWVERLRDFASTAGWPVEAKRLTASFHYRGRADEAEARRLLEAVEERARAEGFRTRWGRKVLEVLPPVEASKRTAVAALLARDGIVRALYAGDDTTDVDAFHALDGLELAVRVAVDSPEAPPALLAAADVVVPGTAGVLELLRRL